MVLARLPSACFIKYETVIGIIGKTHGVKSEMAPNVIASQINDHRSVGCGLFVTGVETVGADAGWLRPSDGPRFTSSEPAKDTRTVLGGMQNVSLQSWKRTSSDRSSMVVSAVALSGTIKLAVSAKNFVTRAVPCMSVNSGSCLTIGFGDSILPSIANCLPSVAFIVVAIGPPSGCSNA